MARVTLARVKRPSPAHAPVIFFGTREIAWVGGKDLVAWADGVAAQLHAKGAKHKAFALAVEEVGGGGGVGGGDGGGGGALAGGAG